MKDVIDFLKTLPENSGQMVNLKCSDKTVKCFFMWFYSDNRIDLKPVDNINIITVNKINFNKITLVF